MWHFGVTPPPASASDGREPDDGPSAQSDVEILTAAAPHGSAEDGITDVTFIAMACPGWGLSVQKNR